MLSTSLHNIFTTTPRIGWIPAEFDPIVMSHKIATLSRENRDLRKRFESEEQRKPELDFFLESEDELCFSFTQTQLIVRQELFPNLFRQAIADSPNTNIKIDISNLDHSGVTSSCKNTVSQENEAQNEMPYGNIFDFQSKKLDAIAFYNATLPSQSEYDSYNKQNARYVNMTENRHKINIYVENNGTISANQIIVSLRFPPELLVFDDYDIETVNKPKMLEIPENPLHHDFDIKKNINKLQAISFLTTIADTSKQTSSLFRAGRALTGIRINYYTENENYLCYKKEKLLHTQTAKSHVFYIVATQKGEYKIDGEIICEELSEPIKKYLQLTSNKVVPMERKIP